MTEKLDIGRVFNAIIDIYRQRLGVLITLSIPFAIVSGILSGLSRYELPFFIGQPIQLGVTLLISTVFAALMIRVVIDIREGRGQRTAGDMLAAITPVLGPLLILAILVFLGTTLGFILLIVPGLYLLTIWAVSAPSLLVERKGPGDALRRSRELVSGNGWQVFGTLILIAIVVGIAAGIIVLILYAIAGVVGAIIALIIVGIFTQPIDGLARAVIYFELIRIKEGGIAAAAPVPGATTPVTQPPPPPPPPA